MKRGIKYDINMSNKNAVWSQHAKERCKERGINKKTIDIEYVKNLMVYTTERGCTKYLDFKDNLVYYVRNGRDDTDYRIVTIIATNPIQMLRYYAFAKGIKFNTLCRDNAFNTCKHGSRCKYIHV